MGLKLRITENVTKNVRSKHNHPFVKASQSLCTGDDLILALAHPFVLAHVFLLMSRHFVSKEEILLFLEEDFNLKRIADCTGVIETTIHSTN